MGQLSILLDVVVATLLVATIVYATVLNRKLAGLRNNKAEMEAMVNRLVEATEQTERGLADLKAAAGEKGDELEKRVKDATALADDLGFLVEKGGSLADRLERQIGQARGAAAAAAGGKPAPAETKPSQTAEAAGKAEALANTFTADSGDEPRNARRAATGGKPRADRPDVPQNAKLLKALRGVR